MSQSSFYSDLNLHVPSKDLAPDYGMFPDNVGRFLFLFFFGGSTLQSLRNAHN